MVSSILARKVFGGSGNCQEGVRKEALKYRVLQYLVSRLARLLPRMHRTPPSRDALLFLPAVRVALSRSIQGASRPGLGTEYPGTRVLGTRRGSCPGTSPSPAGIILPLCAPS